MSRRLRVIGEPVIGRLPAPVKLRLRRLVQRRARWGNLQRARPFGEDYGVSRGTPVDRVYIERFLSDHAGDVHGVCLEVKDASYTRGLGGQAVSHSDVLDVDATNDEATVIADLSEPGSLPSERYDCIILTQTLQLVPDLDAAVRNAWNALAPAGVLLVSMPTIAPVEFGFGAADRWRVTPGGMRTLLERACPDAEIEIAAPGNLAAAIGFLAGLAAEELDQGRLDAQYDKLPIVTCARVAKRRH